MIQIQKNLITRSSIAVTFIAGIGCLAVFYVFLIIGTIKDVVTQGKIVRNSTNLASSVGALKAKYLRLKSGITFEEAIAEGLNKLPTPVFITKREFGRSISIGHEL